jgi:hypothetical protein
MTTAVLERPALTHQGTVDDEETANSIIDSYLRIDKEERYTVNEVRELLYQRAKNRGDWWADAIRN